MDNPSVHVPEYSLYLFSILVVFTIKDILGRSIFVSDGNEELINGALNAVNSAIFS